MYLYKALPHIHFYSNKKNLHFDVVNNLSYKSLNNNEWVSVHEEIQKSIWINKLKTSFFWYFSGCNPRVLGPNPGKGTK